MTALVIAETFLLALLTLLVVGVLRSHAAILRTLHGEADEADLSAIADAEPGGVVDAMDVIGESIDKRAVEFDVRDVGADTILAFLSSSCVTCQTFWRTFADPAFRLPGTTRLVIVAKSRTDDSVSRLNALAPKDYPLILSSSAWKEYRVPVSPYFVYVDGKTNRVIGEGASTSWERVLGLAENAVNDVQFEAELAAKLNGAAVEPPILSEAT